MSLFNSLFGFSNEAGLLLRLLELEPDNIPRFRDCFCDSEQHLIVVHTRTGGGNRECYEVENDLLAAHPLYVKDEDDDFDCTFANFYFNAPDEYAGELKIIFKEHKTIKPSEKWQALFKSMEKDVT